MEAVTELQNNRGRLLLGMALKLISGPLCLALVYSFDAEGMVHGSRFALGTLAWMVVWWVLRPAPWAITALLPLVLFPLSGTLNVVDTAALYGQRVFFWLMGLSLLALALIKHGLAKRVALAFLTIPGVGESTHRLLFFFMLATGFVSMFVSDGSAVAIMLPIGLSIHAYIMSLGGPDRASNQGPQLRTFFALGTLYAAVSGGIATMIGMPHSAVAMAQLETLTGSGIGWFTWMQLGLPISATLLVCNYFLLRGFFKPEVAAIPGGRDFLIGERKKLGSMSLAEKNVLVVFLLMAVLFVFPPLLPDLLGENNTFVLWVDGAISIWMVPPFIMLMLFIAPSSIENRETVLNWKEANEKISWGVLLMVTSAIGVVQALSSFGFTDVMTRIITDMSVDAFGLPYVTGIATSLSTNFMSGVAASALLTAVMVPVAQSLDFSTVAITIMVPATAMGIVFPWAGPTVGTAFGISNIELKDLIRVGIVAEIIMIAVAGTYCLLLEPFL